MPYSIEEFKARAQECVRLANLTDDELMRIELLKLRKAYVEIARRLRDQRFGSRTDQK